MDLNCFSDYPDIFKKEGSPTKPREVIPVEKGMIQIHIPGL